MSYKSVKIDIGCTFAKVTISLGNAKIGATPNFSLTPIVTCPTNVPCARACYANRIYRRLPSVRRAWSGNYRCWLCDPKGVEGALALFLGKYKPRYFRWHVGGDIPDMAYAWMMFRLAENFPGTSFLAYTKRPWKLRRGRPENLTIIRSVWDTPLKTKDNGYGDRWAWSCSEDQAVGTGSVACPASVDDGRSCQNCRLCWSSGSDIVFLR